MTKSKMYLAPGGFAYRVAEDGQSIQFLDTSMNLGWKHSDYMTDKVLKAARPAQEVLDEEAARRGWQPWDEPEKQADKAQCNAVQLAEDVLSAVRHFKGELTADGCRRAVGKSYNSYSGLESGGYQCSPRGVKLIPRDGEFMDLTWAKFIKFCRENGLIENPTAAAGTAPQSAPTASDAQSSPCPSSNADAPTEEKTPLNNYCKTGKSPSGHCGAAACCSEPYECCAQCPNDCNSRCGWIPTKEKSVCAKPVPKPAAAPASLEAQLLDSSAFDFGADAETNAMLLQDAQIFMAGSMARVMAAKRAHDRTAHNYRGSWGKWCELVGISRDTGDNMVRVAEQFGNIQVDGHNLIDLQPMKLLYAASKPSTPPEARAKVENLEITSSKQFQELLARLKATEQELASVQQEAALDRKEQEDANAAALRYKAEADRRAQDQQRLEGRIKILETQAREAERNLAGARDALTAAKARGDRWQEKAEALAAQAAAPAIEARVVDPEEVEQLAAEKAEAIAAQQMAQRDAEDARAAYDAVILATRSMDAAWQALAPMLPRLAPEEKSQAIHQFVQKLICIKEDVLKCL